MSASASENPVRGGNSVRAKINSGWTAFDLKQKRKQQGLVSDNDLEPYPMLPGLNASPSFFNKNGAPLEKPFSSVVVTSMNFPTLMDVENRNLQSRVPVNESCQGRVQNNETAVATEACQKLRYLHPWADESLIQDVLAGVNNNVDEASSLLESRLISEDKDAKNSEADMSFLTNDSVEVSYQESKTERSSVLSMDATKSLPIETEPEWEEDDVYLVHRKDAMRMTRSASRHSKAANDAYLRGDHISARYFSLKAREEWAAAEKLNAKAAKEILAIRNSKNDLWTLDLHGLHAAEAVEALSERLQLVECLVSLNCLSTPNGIHKKPGPLSAASKQRPRILEVITGKGNHSRDAAALPSAIRNFLNENGYHFDETRPGVMIIRPKFRHQ